MLKKEYLRWKVVVNSMIDRIIPIPYFKEFLGFIDDVKSYYNIALDELEEQNANLCDIEHMLELEDLTYHEQARLAKLEKEIRQNRRRAKDNIAVLQPVVDYIEKHPSMINELRSVQGQVNKQEKILKNRSYTKRGNLDLSDIRKREVEK